MKSKTKDNLYMVALLAWISVSTVFSLAVASPWGWMASIVVALIMSLFGLWFFIQIQMIYEMVKNMKEVRKNGKTRRFKKAGCRHPGKTSGARRGNAKDDGINI